LEKTKEDQATIQLELPEYLMDWLITECERLDCTMDDLIGNILKVYLMKSV